MNNLKTVESVVFEILKENKAARNDDMKLYLLVCEKMNPLPCHRKKLQSVYRKYAKS